MRRIIAAILFSLLNVQFAWCEEITLKIGTQQIRAEIASTYQNRQRGLMKRTQLCENCGMLFVFPRSGKYSFWMKDTPLPLSIAFVSAYGRILNIAEMQVNTLDMHSPDGEALYILEMNENWFSRHAIKQGNQVQGLQFAPRGQ